MGKRKLTKRQQWRIEKIQAERRERAQKKSDQLDEQIANEHLGPERHGRIIAQYGAHVDVESLPYEVGTEVFRCYLRANLDALVTGDRVVWRESSGGLGVIVATEPRTSALVRPDPMGKLKPVAANLDQVMIVAAPAPETPPGLIDRYLVATELLGIKACLVLNKTDLWDPEQQPLLTRSLRHLEAIGYPVIYTSIHSQKKMNQLLASLRNKTSALVGQSGVGKSSLTQALLPDEAIDVGPLSEYSGKGTHTTSTSRLFHLPQGGEIIDSPGVREFALWDVSDQEVAEGFIEFRPFLGQCKFRDCSHTTEPGCALQAAVANNLIPAHRMKSFLAILESLRSN